MTPKCECPLAGWCERHKMDKVGRLFELCKDDGPKGESYRQLWDDLANGVKRPEPSILGKIANFTVALVQHALAGFPTVCDETFKTRIGLCETCDFRKPGTWDCTDCGCNLLEKAKWADQECPQKKWLAAAPRDPNAGSPCGCGSTSPPSSPSEQTSTDRPRSRQTLSAG